MTAGHDANPGHGAEGAHTAGDAPPHGAPTHGAAEHGAGEELGPVDYGMWTAGIVGVALGILTAVCFAIAASPVGH